MRSMARPHTPSAPRASSRIPRGSLAGPGRPAGERRALRRSGGRESQALRARSTPSGTACVRPSLCPIQPHRRFVLPRSDGGADLRRHSEPRDADHQEAWVRRSRRSLCNQRAPQRRCAQSAAAVPDLALDEARASTADAWRARGSGARRRRSAARSATDRLRPASARAPQRHTSAATSASASSAARHFQNRSGARS